jgi:hypothetical protein
VPPSRPDPVRDMVLRSVRHHLVTRENNPPDLLPAPDNVDKVSSYSPKPNLVIVHVYTADQGVRQFIVSTTESKLPMGDDS